MRITFLIHSLQLAGAERLVLDLIRCYMNKQIECSLVAIYESSDIHGERKFKEELRAYQVQIVELKKRVGEDTIVTLTKLNRAIKRLDPDIIHAHTCIPNIYAGLRNLLFRKIHTISTLHSGGDDWPNQWNMILEKISIYGIDRIVSVADSVADFYQQKFVKSKGKIIVIENGIDSTKFKRISRAQKILEREKLGVPQELPLLINVARVVPIKKQEFLVDVAYLLKKKNREFKMLFAGNLEDPEYVRNIQDKIDRLDLNNEIQLLGSREDISSLLQVSNIFLFPSLYESFGIALIEAIYCGLPTICSDIPANRKLAEYGDRNYILPYDAELWADKVEEVIQNSNQLARVTPMLSHNKYSSFERVADDYLAQCYKY